MNVEPTIGLAFLAGFVSFISPCVLPLIPAYVGYMSGQATRAAGDDKSHQFGTFLHGVFFVLGFTIFFVGFGVLTTAFSSFLESLGIDIPTILTRLGGVAVIFFGLYVMKFLDPVFRVALSFTEKLKVDQSLAIFFSLIIAVIFFGYYFWVFEAVEFAALALLLTLALFRKPLNQAQSVGDFWYRAIMGLQMGLLTDTRNLEVNQDKSGYLGSTGMGIVFAAGWTPCIGPIYGSILALAASSSSDTGSLVSAGSMLTAYSLGLGIPFLAAALALNQMSGLMSKLKRNMRKVEYASGSLLIIIGVLILSGNLERISRDFQNGELGVISIRIEACTAGLADGRIGWSSVKECVTEGISKLENPVIFAAVKPETAEASDTVELVSADPIFTVDPNFDPSGLEVGLEVGNLAPDFETTTPDGDPISLSDFRGDVVLLNFWWTGCAPCRHEMPDLQAVYSQFKDRGFTVLAINNQESPEQIKPFLEELGLEFPVALDESFKINADTYDIDSYPTSFLIDGHGVIIVGRYRGILPGETLVEVLNQIDAGG